jgi:hypothetical protein
MEETAGIMAGGKDGIGGSGCRKYCGLCRGG